MTGEQQQATDFADRLGKRLGDRLVSAVLYGSAARGGYRKGHSDLNLLILLREVGPAEIAASAELVKRWMEDGNPPPLLLSWSEWDDSADVFPIEYSDIRDAHLLLAGKDPFEKVRIDRQDLRLQLEHELRSKKIQLREGLLASATSPEAVGSLLIQSLSTFLALFRAILRLIAVDVPTDRDALINRLAGELDLDLAAVHAVLAARESGESWPAPLEGPASTGYLAAIEATTQWLDRYEPAEGVGSDI